MVMERLGWTALLNPRSGAVQQREVLSMKGSETVRIVASLKDGGKSVGRDEARFQKCAEEKSRRERRFAQRRNREKASNRVSVNRIDPGW